MSQRYPDVEEDWHVLNEEAARLRADKVELLAALQKIADYFDRGAVRRGADVAVPTIARAAIAKVSK